MEITVLQTSGALEIRQASSLASLGTAVATTYSSTSASSVEPFAVDVTNYGDIRYLDIRNEDEELVYNLMFKFLTSGTFDLAKNRKLIFKIPDSFQGWKELESANPDCQVQPYYDAIDPSDYPQYSHNPWSAAKYYYDTKADAGFVQSWPPEPLDKAIVLVNDVEVPVSKIIEEGNSSKFEDELPLLGGSIKTLYWTSSFSATMPWDSTYTRLTLGGNNEHNTNAKIAHLPASATDSWYWTEDTYAFEPYTSKGWVYSNKLNIYYRSTQVMGVGVLPPFKIQDTLTGLEPSYAGEPMTGNLLIWSETQDSVSQETSDIQLGVLQSQPYVIYTNTTNHDVIIREIIFVVKSQNSTMLTNEDIGVSFDAGDSAIVNIGTGNTSGLSNNILKDARTNVFEWNTYSVITLNSGATIIPPSGVAKLSVSTSFPIEQTVSTIVNGRMV